MSVHYRIVRTCQGHIGVVAGERGLRRLFLPQETEEQVRAAIRSEFPDAGHDEALLPRLTVDLERYFAGESTEFDVPLDDDGASEFLSSVWRDCRRIAYGRTATYKQLAERVGRPGAARAIGLAMRSNPYPIVVPCHRVLRSDGGLGGYSGPGGVKFKRRLLEMEAAARV